jgi:lysophospholipase L1-like esterase
MGDSITQGAHHRDLGTSGFEGWVTEEHAAYTPALLNAGIGGELASHGVGHIAEWLELNPDFQHIALGYGTNDAWGNKNVEAVGFENTLRALIDVILDAGRTPHLGRIPFATAAHGTVPAFNQVIDDLVEEYELPCGPDLYTWFRDNSAELGTDGVHPIKPGNISINRLWAESACYIFTFCVLTRTLFQKANLSFINKTLEHNSCRASFIAI